MNKVPLALRLLAGIAGILGFLWEAPMSAQTGMGPVLLADRDGNQSVRLRWPLDSAGFVLEQAGTLDGAAGWQPVTASAQPVNNDFVVTILATEESRFFRLHALSFARITSSSPANGETGVAVTRETILDFSAPLAASTVLTTNHFFAGFGGQRLLSRIELSKDRTRATLFYLAPMPGSTRVSVVFDSTGLTDQDGRPLDADGDGRPGGAAVVAFDTLSLTPLGGTAVVGRVFASELVPGSDTGTNALNSPLAGVTITVDGMEQSLRAVTDAMGNFKLSPVPAGRFFVHIDGRTVTNLAAGIHYPDSAYYPVVGKAWDAVAGRPDNQAGGTGVIYLPLIKSGTLQTVSASRDTKVEFPPEVVAANPALAGVSITVPANALFGDDGLRGGKVGIAPVPPDRIPSPLPAGLNFPLVITIQTDGPANFDRPVPVRFPNLPDPKTGLRLPAGSASALWSFNHDTGRWEIQGPMTVSADGLFVETDPGFGVRQPGWHGTQPGSSAGGGPTPPNKCKPGRLPPQSEENCDEASATLQGRAFYCELYEKSCKLGCIDCIDNEPAYNACIQFCTASLARCIARQHECPWPPEEK